MTDGADGADGTDADIEGLPLAEAVDAVVAADEGRDPEHVRAALDHVTEDGIVSAAAAEDAVAHTATVVSTPETRVELAGMELENARQAAEPVADLPLVADRLAEFEGRLVDVQARVTDLAETFQTVVDVEETADSLLLVATGIHSVTVEANAVQQAADELTMDLDDFAEWAEQPSVRYDRLDGDAAALADTLDELETAADGVEAVVAGEDETVTLGGQGGVEPGLAWFDATVRQRMLDLLIEDLRAEAEALRTWAEREGLDADPLDDVEENLDGVADRHAALGERLEELAREEWTARFQQPLGALTSTFDGMEPPVDWGEVQATLEQYRTVVE